MVGDLGGTVKWIVRALAAVLRAAWWMLATAWIGVATLRRLAASLQALSAAGNDQLPCPRGHLVPVFGVFDCGTCHALHEGWAFSRCRVCGNTAGWTPCPVCSLPVLNPLRRT